MSIKVFIFTYGLLILFWILRLMSIWILVDSKKYKYSYGMIWAIVNFVFPGTVLLYIIRFKIRKLHKKCVNEDEIIADLSGKTKNNL